VACGADDVHVRVYLPSASGVRFVVFHCVDGVSKIAYFSRPAEHNWPSGMIWRCWPAAAP
jgi:hypothetical protein